MGFAMKQETYTKLMGSSQTPNCIASCLSVLLCALYLVTEHLLFPNLVVNTELHRH